MTNLILDKDMQEILKGVEARKNAAIARGNYVYIQAATLDDGAAIFAALALPSLTKHGKEVCAFLSPESSPEDGLKALFINEIADRTKPGTAEPSHVLVENDDDIHCIVFRPDPNPDYRYLDFRQG